MLSKIVTNFKKLRDIPVYHYIGIGALVLLILLQMSNFLTAFRVTADDNEFYLGFMTAKGWDLWKRGWAYAIPTGRIYHVYIYPFSALSNYLLNFKVTKYLFIGIFVFYGLVPLFWLGRFVGKQIALLAVILFFSLVPSGLNHWPPNSYGYLMFVYSGIYWTRLLFGYIKNKYLQGFITFLSILVVMGTEYNLVLFPLVLLVEYFEDISAFFRGKLSLKELFRRREFMRDLFILSIAWLGYLGFYLLFPTKYHGNQIRIVSWLDIFKVQWEHIYHGLSIAYAQWEFKPIYFSELPWRVGISTLLAGSYALKFSADKKQKINAFIWGVLLAFGATFLIALTPKYFSKCIEDNNCAYIDSRIALIGFTTVISTIFLFVSKYFKPIVPTLGILLLSVISMKTFSYNEKVTKYMNKYNHPFNAVENYLCLTEETTRYDSLVALGITQSKPFAWHNNMEMYKSLFWQLHLKTLRNLKNYTCSGNFTYPLGRELFFRKVGSGNEYLIFGWSFPERWGTWSDGDSALILIKLKEKPKKDIVFSLGLSPYMTDKIQEQTAIIQFLHTPLDTIRWNEKKPRIINVRIPKEYFKDNFLPIILRLPNAISPMEAGEKQASDYRKLAVYIYHLRIKEEG